MYMSLNATQPDSLLDDPTPIPLDMASSIIRMNAGVLSTSSKESISDTGLPQPGKRTFMPNRWGYRGLRPLKVPTDTKPSYGSVSGNPNEGLDYTEWFDVALVGAEGYDETYQVSQCDGVAVGYPILACRTAFETIAMVDPGTGILVRNVTVALNQSYINWCMTPICFKAFVYDTTE